ncbi:hypothetical protein VB834_11250 [Limnoraphis robusta Tam1]|uniref:hypothetical protein n=1 Tax=Limnoraphis robusta TaxID=1118279 RepID=UPI002B1EC6B9|nr:hypothetical protein [Limnoraphis robusta]MEA5499471.1 hypothetical protein [Limnoraphis robusta BA-68 BA1]MEA5539608.1 hypothetical protein [Limnoraphis robusta Tam1]
MQCLIQNNIQPWFHPVIPVYDQFLNWSGKLDYSALDELSTEETLLYWKRFLINEIIPEFYTERVGLLLMSHRTGSWQTSWQVGDQEEYVDRSQLEAILSNTEFYRTFLGEIVNLRTLNNLNISDNQVKITLKKQIYVGAITCLETYLSDAFINTVLSSKEYIKSFFSSFKDFESQKFAMNELLDFAEQAEDIAKKNMLEVLYHNLPKVSNMYKATLGVVFPSIAELQKDILVRHDIVHRNGKTKEGKEIILNDQSVAEVISRVETFINEIDEKLKDK